VEGFLIISQMLCCLIGEKAGRAEIGGSVQRGSNKLNKLFTVMSQMTLLLSSCMEAEALHASALGISIQQFRRNITRKLSTKSTKNTSPIQGQTAIRVSVVIPTYCRPHLLRNCLQCLVDQSFEKNFYEVIVVGDGYDDETKDVVNSFKQFHPAIYYQHLPEKRGPSAARNFGWQRAWGKLIAFTDDDCLPEKTWLASLYKTYQGEREIAYAGKVKVPHSSQPTDDPRNTSNLESTEFVTANCSCTKLALEKVEGFDERFSMAWCEDSDLEFKLLEQCIPVVKVEEAVVIHPVTEAHWGVGIKEQRKGIFNALLFKKFPHLYRKKIQDGPPWNHYMITVAVLCVVAFLFLELKWLAMVFAIFWFVLTVNFIAVRLRQMTRKLNHVLEMIVTSTVIPLVSVYWRLYGAIKYKTLFL
jgi:glycosyltransferase involved in cell wall biosynthesis